jgi:HSP20 family protein
MNREQTPAEELLRRAALDYWFGRGTNETPSARTQRIPVNVYDTGEDIVLVAPMPGVEAENIDIEVWGSAVTLRASLRGPGQTERTYLLHEWTYGPYERTITLPVEVDAQHANASHGNGVLVLSLPKAARAKSVRVPLQQVTRAEETQRGHSGHHTSREGLQDER